MRTSLRIAALTTVVLLMAVPIAQAQASFAGTWVLDRSQSQLPQRFHRGAPDAAGQPTTPAEVTLTVDQSGDAVKATRTVKRGTREFAMSETYTVNGSEQTSTGYRNRTVVTRAAWNGPQLVITKNSTKPSRSGGEIQLTRESVWSMSPDGRTLTIQTTVHGPRGDRTFTGVYQRA
jgi:hypothetical protein